MNAFPATHDANSRPDGRAGRVLVIGANGTIGLSLVPLLVAAGERVVAASRERRFRGELPAEAPGSVEALLLDLTDRPAVGAALDTVDRVFLLNPAEILDAYGVLAPVIEAAAARGVKVVLLSQHRADADEHNPYRQAERLLAASGTRHVILRPNWFSDNFVGFWAEGVAQGTLALPAGDGRISFIDSRDIAAAAAAALQTARFDGEAIELTGPQALDLHEAAERLSTVSGRPVRYQPVDADAYVSALVDAGVPDDYARMLAGLFDLVREGITGDVCDGVERLTGRPARQLELTLRDRGLAGAH